MKRVFLSSLLLVGLTGTAAFAEKWECTFLGQRPDGVLRSQVFVDVNEGRAEAQVFDSLINKMHGAPISARVSADNEKRVTYKWSLKHVSVRRVEAARVNFTLTHLKDTNRAAFFAIAPTLLNDRIGGGAGKTFTVAGSCAPR
jgi:hypothetical protein